MSSSAGNSPTCPQSSMASTRLNTACCGCPNRALAASIFRSIASFGASCPWLSIAARTQSLLEDVQHLRDSWVPELWQDQDRLRPSRCNLLASRRPGGRAL